MYSGSTLTAFSGNVLGAHQKIDRVARRQLNGLAPGIRFPSAPAILHFEGDNGPDGIKRKSPAKDEPWHFIQPYDVSDTQLLGLITHHYERLTQALRENDMVRASFEAAWIAHAIVDGLTPAHQYPYEEKLVELRSGRGKESRDSVRNKLLMPGESTSVQIGNNWKMWGPKGLFTTHAAFEWGVAVLIAPLRFKHAVPTSDKIQHFDAMPINQWFRETAQGVARLQLYDEFYRTGWTIPLARRIRRELAPILIQAVAVTWYGAARAAGVTEAL